MILIDSLVGWSRLQFAVTAGYHWLFVPLTLGLALVMAVMETMYVLKGDMFWKKTAQFWMKIFAINFAVGIATGLILEFEFGTNWSNYSWMVGDIFGAPLAIEGILAFFMEATFFAVMFFGWEKVGKGFHLTSTWLTGIGATISAYWILVANGWMQNPVGTVFNPQTMRNEMTSFWQVAANPVAVSKFAHAVTSGWMTGGIVTMGISAWYLLKGRHVEFARRSMLTGALVALLGGVAVMLSGDSSGIHAAKYQPMKLAACEGLKDGGGRASFSIVPGVEVPGMLSILATHDPDGYVPGINDIVNGYTDNEGNVIPSIEEKMLRGKAVLGSLRTFRSDTADAGRKEAAAAVIARDARYMGYGYLQDAREAIPPVTLVYWAFRCMVGSGMLLLLVVLLTLWFLYSEHRLARQGYAEKAARRNIAGKRWLLAACIICVPFVYLCGQAGWIVAEVGRQPWAIQDLLPVGKAVSGLSVGAVKTTFFVFLAVFAFFLIAEVKIMFNAIKEGPDIR